MSSDGILTGLRGRDLNIVGATWVRFAIRSGGGVVALFIVLVIGLYFSSFVLDQAVNLVTPGEGAEISQEKAASRVEGLARNFLGGLLVVDEHKQDAEIDFLTKERPAVLSANFILLFFLVPFAACAAAFNQTASDIGTRGLRFLLSRTERPNIFVGRFLGATFFMAVSLAVLVAVVTLYTTTRIGVYSLGDSLLSSAEGWLALFAFSVPFIALCSWISCTQRTPFASLALCYCAAVLPWLLLKVVVGMMDGLDIDIEFLNYLTPWHWRHDLLASEALIRLRGAGLMIGFTLLFLFGGLVNFKKRDL